MEEEREEEEKREEEESEEEKRRKRGKRECDEVFGRWRMSGKIRAVFRVLFTF